MMLPPMLPLPSKRLLLALACTIIACTPLTQGCYPRSSSRPRPEEQTTTTSSTVAPLPPENVAEGPPRPNITFPILNCPPTYAAWYCLNDATCFTVEIHNEILYNCECALGYMGPRCEYKEIDGSYLPTRSRVMLEKASIVSGSTLAFILMAMLIIWCLRKESRKKKELHDSGTDVGDLACENAGMDVVDGMTQPFPPRRPFRPDRILTLEEAFQALNKH
ncbi:protein spitz [Scaptodrosophila lebanonensis]|uniref:Protein spitz n=1 Tax=Drosophila lebanonensis TaxID=7225 RepID=A0A6J2UCZ7_DROLE|nr:protein spitz [Scaptodrosophila lebanonensis]XP_030384998.1 protein spitz [Scaptodrosophila lebanonensis]